MRCCFVVSPESAAGWLAVATLISSGSVEILLGDLVRAHNTTLSCDYPVF